MPRRRQWRSPATRVLRCRGRCADRINGGAAITSYEVTVLDALGARLFLDGLYG